MVNVGVFVVLTAWAESKRRKRAWRGDPTGVFGKGSIWPEEFMAEDLGEEDKISSVMFLGLNLWQQTAP
jgi:hypothetical protein